MGTRHRVETLEDGGAVMLEGTVFEEEEEEKLEFIRCWLEGGEAVEGGEEVA